MGQGSRCTKDYEDLLLFNDSRVCDWRSRDRGPESHRVWVFACLVLNVLSEVDYTGILGLRIRDKNGNYG